MHKLLVHTYTHTITSNNKEFELFLLAITEQPQ